MAKNNANQDNIIIQKLNNIISALSEIKRKNSQTESYSKRRKKSKREIFHFIIQGLGLLILFGSWIAQNIYQNSWEDKKNRFDSNFNLLVQSQLGVFSQEIAAKSFLGLNIITKDTNYIIQANTIRYLSLYCQDYILLQKMINSTLNIDKNMLSDESYLKIWNNLKEDSIAIARNFNNKNIDSLNYYVNYYISDTENKKINSQIELLRNYNEKILNQLNNTNTLFIVLYIIGSILLGFEYIRKYFSDKDV